MKWSKAQRNRDGSVEVPSDWLLLHYYEALTILFRIENALRIFVYMILKNEFFEKWVERHLASDDSDEGTIESIAKKRINQLRNFGYLGYSSTCPIMYMTSGELVRLMTSESNWPYFKRYFAASKEVIKHKLDEISTVRNSLAHFRPVREDDIELVKQNAKHVFVEVEPCILRMLQCANIVPTNTVESWYRNLNTLGTEHCDFRFRQSADEEWIRIEMKYDCPVVSRIERAESWIAFRVLNLLSSSIVRKYANLRNLVTYLERT